MRWMLVLAVFQCSCATMYTTTRVENNVDRKYEQVVRSPDKVTVTDTSWDGTTAVAHLDQTVLCSTFHKEDRTSRTYADTETKRVGLQVAVGTVAIVTGGVLGYLATDFSDEPNVDSGTGSDQDIGYSDQDIGYGTALLLGAVGLFEVGQGIYIWSRGGTRVLDEKHQTGFLVSEDPSEPCETLPYNGLAQVSLGARLVDTRVVKGELRLEVSPEDCGPSPARVLVAANEVGQISTQDCYFANQANIALDRISRIEQPIDSATLLKAVVDLTAAQDAVSKIQSTYWRNPVTAKLEVLRSEVRVVSERVIDDLFVQLKLDLKNEDENSAVTAQRLLVVATTVGTSPREDFRRMLAEIAGVPRSTPRLVENFVDVFPHAYRVCIRDGQCDGLAISQQDYLDAVAPGFETVGLVLNTRTSAVENATKALSNKPTESNLSAVDHAVENVTRLVELACHVGIPIVGLQTPCDDANVALTRAAAAKIEAQEAIDAQRARRTKKEWEAIYPQCRKVSAGLEAFHDVRRCGGECQQAISKLREDLQELSQFQPENATYTVETIQQIRTSCAKAGCPNCP